MCLKGSIFKLQPPKISESIQLEICIDSEILEGIAQKLSIPGSFLYVSQQSPGRIGVKLIFSHFVLVKWAKIK